MILYGTKQSVLFWHHFLSLFVLNTEKPRVESTLTSFVQFLKQSAIVPKGRTATQFLCDLREIVHTAHRQAEFQTSHPRELKAHRRVDCFRVPFLCQHVNSSRRIKLQG